MTGWPQAFFDSLDASVRSQIRVDPFRRDPEFVERLMPLVRAANLYHGTEVRGWKNVPAEGPMLIVGNHSGGAETTDLAFLLEKWVDERGPEAPLYSLGYDLLFANPTIADWLRRVGILPASQRNARDALRKGAAVLVFPGGDYEVFRPWSERNHVDFGGRTGFIELAISTGVPVVPMTIHGAHQSTIVLTRGRRIARLSGLDRLHVKVFPFIWNIPLGLTPAFVPSVPLPAKVTIQLGKPLDWSHFGKRRARDPKVRRACYDEITAAMQKDLDALAGEHPHPILARVEELDPRRVASRLLRGDSGRERSRRGAGRAAATKPRQRSTRRR